VKNHGTISHSNFKHLFTTGNLHEHVEIIWGIQSQKNLRQKDDVLDKLFQEQVFHSLSGCELCDFQSLLAYVNVVELQMRYQKAWPFGG
jgi:hypothetical protein